MAEIRGGRAYDYQKEIANIYGFAVSINGLRER